MDFSKYDAIRPLLPHEVPTAIKELLQEESLRSAYEELSAKPKWEDLSHLLASCQSVSDFKRMFSAHLVRHIMSLTCASVADLEGLEHITSDGAYTYISNHRDIILDSAFLNVLLHEAGAKFPEIAIGDNLLVTPWVEKLVKLNGNFLVRRGLQGREVLLAAKELSGYMNEAVAYGISVWIAQREGRAKDSNDRTQAALLKMLSLCGGQRGIVANLRQLNIIPTTCSYEYDPCDYLKAQEMQLKRDMPDYKKTKADDALNMKTGVMGYKGRVVFRLGRALNELLDTAEVESLPEVERADAIAALLDKEIHRNYEIYPINYIALDMLSGKAVYSDKYTEVDYEQFSTYLSKQISRVCLPEGYEKDDDFLRSCLLTMYANPLINHLKAVAQN